MDSRMLEVAIGLALVFALFGLLITTVQEAIAQWTKSRGKTLHQAIASLLGDDARLAEALSKHALLVSMAKGAKETSLRPSYLSADVFVSALIDFLAQRHLHGGKPPTPAEFVSGLETAAATAPPPASLNENLVGSLRALLPGAELDWPAFEKRLCAWYDAVNERATGWYKRKTQLSTLLLGTAIAAALNINPLVIGPRLWDDDVLRMSLVTAGQQAAKAFDEGMAGAAPGDAAAAASAQNAAAAAALGSINAQRAAAGNTTQALQATEQSGAVETQLAGIGHALEGAAALAAGRTINASSTALQRAHASLARLRQALDELRLGEDGSLERQRKTAQAQLSLDGEIAALTALAASPAARSLVDDLPARIETLEKAIDGELRQRREGRSEARLGACANAQSAQARDICQRTNDLMSLQLAGLPMGWAPPYLPRVFKESACRHVGLTRVDLRERIATNKDLPKDSPQDACAGLGLLANPNIWLAFAGWFITGVAGMLGAPFWFDLLSRLVKLRGAGGKPSSDTAATPAPADAGGAGGVMAQPAAAAAPAPVPASRDVLNAAEATLSTAEVEEIQRRLGVAATGYFNKATRDAIAVHQKGRLRTATGEMTATDIFELLGRAPAGDADGYVV